MSTTRPDWASEGSDFESDSNEGQTQQSGVTYLAPFNRTKLFQSDDLDDMMEMQQQFMSSRQAPSAAFTKSNPVSASIVTAPNPASSNNATTTPAAATKDQFEVVDMFLGHTPGFEGLIGTVDPSEDEPTAPTHAMSAQDEDWFNEQPDEYLPNRGRMGGGDSMGPTSHKDDILSQLPQEYLQAKGLGENTPNTTQKPHTTSFQRVSAASSSYFSQKKSDPVAAAAPAAGGLQPSSQPRVYKPAGFGSHLTRDYVINQDMPEDLNKPTTDSFNSAAQASLNETGLKPTSTSKLLNQTAADSGPKVFTTSKTLLSTDLNPLPLDPAQLRNFNKPATQSQSSTPQTLPESFNIPGITITDVTGQSGSTLDSQGSSIPERVKPGQNAVVTNTRTKPSPTTGSQSIDDDDDMGQLVVKARQRPVRRGPPGTSTAPAPTTTTTTTTPAPTAHTPSGSSGSGLTHALPLTRGSFEHALPQTQPGPSSPHHPGRDDYDPSQIPAGLTVNSDTIRVSQLAKNIAQSNQTSSSAHGPNETSPNSPLQSTPQALQQQRKQEFSNPRNFLAGMDVSFTRPIPTMFREDAPASSASTSNATAGVEQRTGGARLDLSGQVVQRQRPRRGPPPGAYPALAASQAQTTPSSPNVDTAQNADSKTEAASAVISPKSNFAQSRFAAAAHASAAAPAPLASAQPPASRYDTGESFRLKDTLPTYIPRQSSLAAMQKIVKKTAAAAGSSPGTSSGLDDIDAQSETDADGDSSDEGSFDPTEVGVSQSEIDSTVQMLLAQMQSMGASVGDYLSEALSGWSPEQVEAFKNRKKGGAGRSEENSEDGEAVKETADSTTTTTTATATPSAPSGPAKKQSRFAASRQKKQADVTSFLQSIDSSVPLSGAAGSESSLCASKLTKRETPDPDASGRSGNRSVDDNFANAELYRSILNAHNRPVEQQRVTDRAAIRVVGAGQDAASSSAQPSSIPKYSQLAAQIEPWELIPSLRNKYANAVQASAKAKSTRATSAKKGSRWDPSGWLAPVDSTDNALVNHQQVPTGNNNIFLLSQVATKQNSTKGAETTTNLQLYQRLSTLFQMNQNTNHRDSSYVALTTQLTDLRFDLEGKIAPPFYSQNLSIPVFSPSSAHSSSSPAPTPLEPYQPSQRELFHHGNQPHRAGYTIDELVLYLRSTYPNQISLALRAVNSIVSNARQGLYYQFCVGQEEQDTEGDESPTIIVPSSVQKPPSVHSWVEKNISSTILETILIREIPQLCLYLLINNQNGLQNQQNHSSTLVYYTLSTISTLLSPNFNPALTKMMTVPPPSLPLALPASIPKPLAARIPSHSALSLATKAAGMCPCHMYSEHSAANVQFLHFLTSPATTTLPQHLRVSPSSHPISPLHSSNISGAPGQGSRQALDSLLGSPMARNNSDKSSPFWVQTSTKVTPRFHTCVGTACPHKTNPYQNKGYYTHTDTPHYIQRALQSLYFEFTHPKILAMSKSRNIPLALLAQLDDEELAKGIMSNGLVDTNQTPEHQKVQLYSLLSSQKREVYLQASLKYAEDVRFCVSRGNQHWNIDGMGANQLFLYDLVFGTLSIGTLSQLITLLQYYTYFTDPSLLASLFKNKAAKGKKQAAATPSPLDSLANTDSAPDGTASSADTQRSQHSQFLSIQLLVLDVLLSLCKHSHTTAAITACTDGLTSLLSKFLSVPALMALGAAPQFSPPSESTLPQPRQVNPNRLALERRLVLTVDLLLQMADSHPVLLSEVDHQVSGSIISYLILLTDNAKIQAGSTTPDLDAGAHGALSEANIPVLGAVLEKVNIINPLLWFIISMFNGGSTVLPLSLFDFNSNNIYMLFRSINTLLALVLELVGTSNDFPNLTLQYPALPLFLSQLLTIHCQLHLYIVSHLEEEEAQIKPSTTTASGTPQAFQSILLSTETLEAYIESSTLQTHTPLRSEFISTPTIARKLSQLVSNVQPNPCFYPVLTAVAQWCRFSTMLSQFYLSNDPNSAVTTQLRATLIEIKQDLSCAISSIKQRVVDGDNLFPIPNSTSVLQMIELHHAFPTYPVPHPTYPSGSAPRSTTSDQASGRQSDEDDIGARDFLGDLLTQVDKLEAVFSLYDSLSEEPISASTPPVSAKSFKKDETSAAPDGNVALIDSVDSMVADLRFAAVAFEQFLVRPDVIMAQDRVSSENGTQHPLTHFNQNDMFFGKFLMNAASAPSHSETQFLAHLLLRTIAIFTRSLNFFKTEANDHEKKLIFEPNNEQHVNLQNQSSSADPTSPISTFFYPCNPTADAKLSELFTQLYTTLSLAYTAGYFITHILLLTNHHPTATQVFVMLLCNIAVVNFLSQFPTTTDAQAFIQLQRLLHKTLSPLVTSSLEEIDETPGADDAADDIEAQLQLESLFANQLDFQDTKAEKLQTQHGINLKLLHHTLSHVILVNTPVFSSPALPGTPVSYFTPLPHLTTPVDSQETASEGLIDSGLVSDGSSGNAKHETIDLSPFKHSSELYGLLISSLGQFSNVVLPTQLLKSSVFPPAPQHIISHPCLFLPDTVSTPASLRGLVSITNLVSMGFGMIGQTQNGVAGYSDSDLPKTTINEMVFKNALFYLFASLSSQPYLLQNFSNDLINDTHRTANSSIQHELIPQWLYDSFFITTFLSYSAKSQPGQATALTPFVNLNWALFFNLTTVFEQVLGSFVENGENIIFIAFLVLLVSAPINGQVFKVIQKPMNSAVKPVPKSSTDGAQVAETNIEAENVEAENENQASYTALSTPSRNQTLQFITAITLTIMDLFPNLLTSFANQSLLLVPSFEQKQAIAQNNFKFVPPTDPTASTPSSPLSVLPYVNPLMLSMAMMLTMSPGSGQTAQSNAPILLSLNFGHPVPLLSAPASASANTLAHVGYSLSFVKALCQIAASHFKRGLAKALPPSPPPTISFPSLLAAVIEPIIASALVSPIAVDAASTSSHYLALQKVALVFQTLVLSLDDKNVPTEVHDESYQRNPLYTKLVLELSANKGTIDLSKHSLQQYRDMAPPIKDIPSEPVASNKTEAIEFVTRLIKAGICASPVPIPLDTVCNTLFTVYLEQCVDLIKYHQALLGIALEDQSVSSPTDFAFGADFNKAITTLFRLIDSLDQIRRDAV